MSPTKWRLFRLALNALTEIHWRCAVVYMYIAANIIILNGMSYGM